MTKKRSIEKSNAWWKRAEGLIPAGTQTFSKGPTQFVDGVAPKYIQRAEGSHLWDVDGNEYIDYLTALGPIILGYNHPGTNEAVKEQLKDGITYTLMHPLEVEVAEMLRDIIPCAEMVRFGKNGSDVTTGAVRLARAYTGREMVAHCGYHGWHDWYIGSTGRNKGVPKAEIANQVGFYYNDIESLKKLFDQHKGKIACVIMEPYILTEPKGDFLQQVKDLTHQNGAVFIFDEVASGFRYCYGGVHQKLGVDPDLACFGKAMANGMPISALVGKKEIMKLLEEVFFSFTFGGECLSLAATKATLIELKTKKDYEWIWNYGNRLEAEIKGMIQKNGLENVVSTMGWAPRNYLLFKDSGKSTSLLLKSLFQQEAIKRGILFPGVHLPTFSHSEDDLKATVEAYQECFPLLKAAVEADDVQGRLEGRPLQPIFRQVVQTKK